MSLGEWHSAALQDSRWIGLPGVVFRPGDGLLEIDGQTHRLTPKASALLQQLALAYPHAARRDALLDALWGSGRGSPESLAQVVAELRRKLGEEARAPRYIRTVSKVGFQLLVEPIALTEPQGGAFAASDDAPLPPDAKAAASSSPQPVRRRTVLTLLALAGLTVLIVGLDPRRSPAPLPRLQIVADDAVIETMPRGTGTDGGLVYALQDPASGDFDIAYAEPGQARPRVIRNPDGAEYSPVVTTDGRQLAFVRQQEGSCVVILSDASGGLEREITRCQPAGPGQLIDMSADGRWLAYTAPTNAEYESRAIEVFDLHSNRVVERTDAHSALHTDHGPRLAADGAQLSFFRHDYQTGEINLRLHQDGRSRLLPAPPGERLVAHAWSPRNRLYAISSSGSSARLVELALPGGQIKRVIANIPDGRNLAYDGRRFLYSTAFVADTYLARFDFAGPTPDRLTSARSGHRLPQLSPSGKRLLFATQSNQDAEIWATDLDSGDSQRLAAFAGSEVLALQWRAADQAVDALLEDESGTTRRLRLAFPGGSQRLDQPYPGARALVGSGASGATLIRDGSGRYYRDCADLAATDGSARALATDAMVIRASNGGYAASRQSQTGIWAMDAQMQTTQRLADYVRGSDYSWAINGPWYVRLQQDSPSGTMLRLLRTNLLDGTEVSVRADQLDLTAGVEVTADGEVFAVLNELEDVDIAMLAWVEDQHR